MPCNFCGCFFFCCHRNADEQNVMGRHKAATTRIYNRKRKLKQKQAKRGDQTELHSRKVTSSQPLPNAPTCVGTCTQVERVDGLHSRQATSSQPLPDTPICVSTCTQDSDSENSLPPFVDSRLCSNQCTGSNNTTSTECTTSTVKTKQSSLPDWEFLNDPLFLRFREYTLLRHRINMVSFTL